MLTDKERRELIERASDSFSQLQEASKRAVSAGLRASVAWQRHIDLGSNVCDEMGLGRVNAQEVVDYLISKGRRSEAADFVRDALATLEADREAETAATEAEIASARAETFVADELNHGILDRENGEVVAWLKSQREHQKLWREPDNRQRILALSGIEQTLRQKLKELEE